MSHTILVHTTSRQLFWPGGRVTCAIGKNGVTPESDKREGDGKTPLGIYPLRGVYFRADRIAQPLTLLPTLAIESDMGWCDASDDAQYNKFIRHPSSSGAEHLWREDGLYDIIVTLGHNDDPVVPNRGSAIFLHCCKYGDSGAMKPTLGCVAIPRSQLLSVLAVATPETTIEIY
jgi:L,D-peptidoglycan transpeptidase YkuD (ErfK/YbiS/YcfS/YnhG family)